VHKFVSFKHVMYRSRLYNNTGEVARNIIAFIVIYSNQYFHCCKYSRDVDSEKSSHTNNNLTSQSLGPLSSHSIHPRGSVSVSKANGGIMGKGPLLRSKSKDVSFKSTKVCTTQDILGKYIQSMRVGKLSIENLYRMNWAIYCRLKVKMVHVESKSCKPFSYKQERF